MDGMDLVQKLKRHGQEHLLAFADRLADAERRALFAQIEELDFAALERLYREAQSEAVAIDPAAVGPAPAIPLPRDPAGHARDRGARERGLELIRSGKVGVVLVAGGQGSRLGFEHPKGMFPIGPVAGTSLFQMHAEQILAWREKLKAQVPWYIMTSPNNRDETVAFFRANRYFGLPESDVMFFVQGTMPALDAATGKVLLASPGEVFTGPNGHGGTLLALRKEGLLADMAERGVEEVFYFQVDNPFVRILDPTFLGHHHQAKAEVSLKVIRKQSAKEKLGLVVLYQGRATIIEYSDLPAEVGERVDGDGALVHWTGSIAIHAFQRVFLERITSGAVSLPCHFARKAVPHMGPAGVLIRPAAPNAIKFEMFIFDCLPLAERVVVVETDRSEEYEPVKNATGEHSPEVVRAALSRRAARWAQAAGIAVPTDARGEPAVALEISPLAGIEWEDFRATVRSVPALDKPTYFTREGVITP